jgi:hypothetical protein
MLAKAGLRRRTPKTDEQMKRTLATLALAMALAASSAGAEASWPASMFGLQTAVAPNLDVPLPASAMTDGLTEERKP